jgi:transposase-like protein
MEKHGRGKRRTFSAEYKAAAVQLAGESGKRIGVIALELGLGDRVAPLGAASRG